MIEDGDDAMIRAGTMTGPVHVGIPLRVALCAAFATALLAGAWFVAEAVGASPGRDDIVDFNVFHLAGRMAWQGNFADAYRASTMLRLERSLGGGRDVFMPFSYPPLFGLVLAILAVLPVGLACLALTATSLALYLTVLRRLAGPWFWPILFAVAPAVLQNLRVGQNGLLTGGLIGLSALLALGRHRWSAGIVIGTLAIKPHLAPMLPVFLLLRRDWRGLAAAAASAAALTEASLLVFGPGTFAAFLASFSDVGRFLALGLYPLHRMTTVFSCLVSLGVPLAPASVAHAAVAAAVLLLAVRTALACGDPRVGLGLCVMSTAFLSPYLYDYDQTTFGVGLALVMPRLARVMPRTRVVLLLSAVAGTGLAAMLQDPLAEFVAAARLSLMGPVLLACFVVIASTLRRAPAEAAARGDGAETAVRLACATPG